MLRKRILLVAEAVTLAHVGRPLALAAALDPTRYELHLACAPGHEVFLRDSGLTHWTIHSISSAPFLAALAAGEAVYDLATLRRYVEQDLHLPGTVHPDLVLGDFRLSLSVSARGGAPAPMRPMNTARSKWAGPIRRAIRPVSAWACAWMPRVAQKARHSRT